MPGFASRWCPWLCPFELAIWDDWCCGWPWLQGGVVEESDQACEARQGNFAPMCHSESSQEEKTVIIWRPGIGNQPFCENF